MVSVDAKFNLMNFNLIGFGIPLSLSVIATSEYAEKPFIFTDINGTIRFVICPIADIEVPSSKKLHLIGISMPIVSF
jgi:hypothetical protein